MRSIHLVLTGQYLPLQFIDTPDELQQVLCGAVTGLVFFDTDEVALTLVISGHHQAWKQTGILRCEIRISNIVFHRTPTGIVGVFCDLDIPDGIEEVLQVGQEEPLIVNQSQHERSEKTVREEEFQERLIDDQSDSKYKRKYLTGMVPFMALDLLASVPAPTHLYRHDLESFFWVLTYFVATHDLDRHALRCIISWMDTNPQRIRRSKTQFLTKVSYREGILDRKNPQYEGFVDKVLLRLYILFKIVEIKRRTLMISHIGYWKSLARQSELAQAYYAKDIERISKSRNNLVPFDQFMGDLTSQRELHPYDIMAINCYS